MTASTLPSIKAVFSGASGPNSPLATVLSILFEYSPILSTTLEPQLHQILEHSAPPRTYAQLIDIAIAQIGSWDKSLQSQFISGHPRIGESKNLSSLSATEQGHAGSATPTPPDVLARLAHLNAYYEARYPGLRYIIFVNGRSRAEVAEILEDQLGLEHSLDPCHPPVSATTSVEIGGDEWSSELERAVKDVGLIAKSRLKALGVE